MVKYIMTFKGAPDARRANAELLATQIGGNVYEGSRRTIDNLQAILELASKGFDDLLLLEDDVNLCSDFLQEVDNAVARFPTSVINFNWQKENIGCFLPFSIFTELQCVYIPREVVRALLTVLPLFRLKQPNFVYTNDHEKLLQYLKGEFYAYPYNLVNQNAWKSTIFGGCIDKPSKYFKDTLYGTSN